MSISEITFRPLGAHVSGPNIATAQTLTPPDGGRLCLMQAISQNVRFTLDGTVPTTTLGFQLKAGDQPVIIPVVDGGVIKVIQEAATASLQYQWGGYW